MTEIIMNNVREELSKAREKCIGMSEEVYAVTDYMSIVANDSLYPFGLVVCLALVMDHMEQGKFVNCSNKELTQYLGEHKNQVMIQMPYVLQVIDEIAEPEFAEEVRSICKQVMDWNPPKRVKAELDGNYPEYVKVAVDWWANAIASPNFDNGDDDMPKIFLQYKASQSFIITVENAFIFFDKGVAEIEHTNFLYHILINKQLGVIIHLSAVLGPVTHILKILFTVNEIDDCRGNRYYRDKQCRPPHSRGGCKDHDIADKAY